MAGITKKQLVAAKKRRGTTLRKLDKLYKESEKLEDYKDKIRVKWNICIMKIKKLNVTKKEFVKMEKPCKTMQKEMKKIDTKVKNLSKKIEGLEKKADDIEEKFGIPADKSYTPVLSK
jgi:hypothetical protein